MAVGLIYSILSSGVWILVTSPSFIVIASKPSLIKLAWSEESLFSIILVMLGLIYSILSSGVWILVTSPSFIVIASKPSLIKLAWSEESLFSIILVMFFSLQISQSLSYITIIYCYCIKTFFNKACVVRGIFIFYNISYVFFITNFTKPI